MKRRLLAALVLPLTLAACGDDDAKEEPEPDVSSLASEPSSSSPGTETAESTESTESGASTEGVDGGPLTEDDRSAIEDTIKKFLVTGDCDLATDDYLRDLSLFADEDTTREEACAAWEKTFVEPLYTKEDILLTELVGEDGVATVQVGSEVAPEVTITYRLSLVEGDWLVSGDEINTDGL